MTNKEQDLLDTISDLRSDCEQYKASIREQKDEIEELEGKVDDLEDELQGYEDHESEPEFSSLNDQTKYDFFIENFDKINLEQLENLVK